MALSPCYVPPYSSARGSALYALWQFHGSLTAERRSASLAAFRKATHNHWEDKSVDGAPPRVLIATGRAVRGLDLRRLSQHDKGIEPMPLDCVVLFDFAPDAKSYLARVGCATRGTQEPARVTALAVGSQLAFAKALLANDAKGNAHSVQAQSELA